MLLPKGVASSNTTIWWLTNSMLKKKIKKKKTSFEILDQLQRFNFCFSNFTQSGTLPKYCLILANYSLNTIVSYVVLQSLFPLIFS